MWNEFDKIKPQSGDKVVFIYDDGSSSSVAMAVDGQDGGVSILDAEDAVEMDEKWLRGAIWAKLPDDYPIAFTETTADDWR